MINMNERLRGKITLLEDYIDNNYHYCGIWLSRDVISNITGLSIDELNMFISHSNMFLEKANGFLTTKNIFKKHTNIREKLKFYFK